MRRTVSFGIPLFVILLILSGCNLPKRTPTPAMSDLVNTAAAQTIAAFNTQLAAIDQTSQPPAPSAVSTTAAATPLPTIGPQTAEPISTNTPKPTALPCNVALFLKDVTVEDGQPFPPGAKFTKTWLLQNGGSCTWVDGYALVFANEGNSMGGPASKQLDNVPVLPGETVEVSVDLTAPSQPGTYRGGWRLRDTKNETFGRFWVEIKVVEVHEGEYAFADNLCSAEWRAGTKTLKCPGSQDDTNGYVVRLDNPKFENGYIDDEPAIVVSPEQVDHGEISGIYLPIKVPENSTFRTVIGCMYNAPDCNVRFVLIAQPDGESEKLLGEWVETSDGNIAHIDINLTEKGLAGKKVVFKFIVKANGSPSGDKAIWLNPRVSEK